MIGLPVKSPSPPACDAETENALVRVGTVVGEIFFSFGCDRVLARS